MPDLSFVGRYFEQTGALTVEQTDFGPVVGFSAGKLKHHNEDVARVGGFQDNLLFLAVADGHWGYQAAEYFCGPALNDLLPYLTRLMTEHELEDCREVIADVLDEHNNHLQLQTGAETTLLVVCASPTKLTYLSFGDSFLYTLRRDNSTCVNNPHPVWLGGRVGADQIHDWLEVGVVEDWVKVLVASDGLPECVYGSPTISCEEVFNIMRGTTTTQEWVQTLCGRALEAGGEDNLAVAGLSVEDCPPSDPTKPKPSV